jgi:hypothetical protein
MNNYYDNIDIEREFDIVPNDEDEYNEQIYEENLNFSSSIRNIINPKRYNYINEKNICDNEYCLIVSNEINKLTEECINLEKKYLLLERMHTKYIIEKTEKLNELTNNITNIYNKIDKFEGKNLDKLSYTKLTKLELNLLKLLNKIKIRISKFEMEAILGINEAKNCKNCNTVKINCIIRPCNHLCVCHSCVQRLIKCPICYNYIEFYEKFFLPNN